MAIWCKKCNRPNPKNHEKFMMFFFDLWCMCERTTKGAKKAEKKLRAIVAKARGETE